MSTKMKVGSKRRRNGNLVRLTYKDRAKKAEHNLRTGRTRRLAERRRIGKLL